jgi:protein-S-isoprenylcysteine O-methyltransferase Ste14
MIRLIFFSSAIFMEVIYLGLFIATIKRPLFRFWPPPSARSWQFFAAWIMACLVLVEFAFLGILDYDSFILPGLRERLPYAIAIFVIGCAISFWVSIGFHLKTTIGLGDKLIITGAYRYSRNPQYICDSLNAIGFFVLSNSWMVGIVGLLGITLNLLAPFTEEPWLEQRFGEQYRQYKSQVPRFIGRRKNGVAR